MWWSERSGRRLSAALVPMVLLCACGFTPLYDPGSDASVMRGKVEYVLMRVTEAIMVLPGFLIAMAVISTLGSSTTVLILTLVAFSWTYTARVIYGETLRLREMLFVEAAELVIRLDQFRFQVVVLRHGCLLLHTGKK